MNAKKLHELAELSKELIVHFRDKGAELKKGGGQWKMNVKLMEKPDRYGIKAFIK